MNDFINARINFSAQPYHAGEAEIVAVRPGSGGWEKYLVLEVRTTEATETSRLGAHSISRSFNGRDLTLYYYSEEQVAEAIQTGKRLIHVYPV